MRCATHPAPLPHHTPPLTVDQEFAAKLSGLSSKTLGRFAARGEQVGRLKVGRRVLYHVPTLTAWLAARAGVAATPTHLAEGLPR